MAARAGAFFIGMSLRRWSMSRGISLRAGKAVSIYMPIFVAISWGA